MLNVVTCFLNVDTFFTAIMGRKGRAINFLRGGWLKNLHRKLWEKNQASAFYQPGPFFLDDCTNFFPP